MDTKAIAKEAAKTLPEIARQKAHKMNAKTLAIKFDRIARQQRAPLPIADAALMLQLWLCGL